MKNKMIWLAALLLSGNVASADNTRINIGEFAKGSVKGWETKSFSGLSQYAIQQQGNRKVLKATSKGTASAFGRRARIDLTKTPFLNWSWRVDKPLSNLPEKTKAGDDYAARVYVLIDGGLLVWRTKALNYVWSSNAKYKNTRWNNAFAPKNAKMLALRDKADGPGKWITEKRNIAQDFKLMYGFVPRFIDGVAVMSDTDNSRGESAASFGDIFFSAK